jgi:hypothetical protein
MRLINLSCLQGAVFIEAVVVSPINAPAANATARSGHSSDPGWPRERYQDGTRLIIYEPQVDDDWKDFQNSSWRMAVSLAPKSGNEVVGVVEMKGHIDIDNIAKVVIITNPEVTKTYFEFNFQLSLESRTPTIHVTKNI